MGGTGERSALEQTIGLCVACRERKNNKETDLKSILSVTIMCRQRYPTSGIKDAAVQGVGVSSGPWHVTERRDTAFRARVHSTGPPPPTTGGAAEHSPTTKHSKDLLPREASPTLGIRPVPLVVTEVLSPLRSRPDAAWAPSWALSVSSQVLHAQAFPASGISKERVHRQPVLVGLRRRLMARGCLRDYF